jgi:cytochrome b6-f complex iron-sulfur subunit
MAKKLSVEEVLAACHADDGDGSESATPAPADTPAAAPAETAAPAAKDAAAMSVEDMMAAARGEKAAPAAPAAKKDAAAMSIEDMMAAARGEKTAAAKPAAKKAAKPAAKPKAAAKADGATAAKGPRDTASVLAAARKANKPGPMSKAEAAKKGGVTAGKKKLTVPPMPEKPAYAVATAVTSPAADPDRRGFMSACVNAFFGSSLAVGFTSLAITNLLWVLGTARFMFPNILTEPPTQFKVGFPGEFGPGQVETKFKAQFGVWVVKHIYNGQSQIYALQSVCTHLGCTPNWLEGEQKFKCPCHGSGFYKDGVNFEGPAPRPLERFAIKLSGDGQLEVDKSRKFLEELGQWEDPSSFVSV